MTCSTNRQQEFWKQYKIVLSPAYTGLEELIIKLLGIL